MTKKKEYILLFVIIVLIAFYLGFKDNGRENYELPMLADLNLSKITKVDLKKGSSLIEIEKGSDNIWYILPDKFPADRDKVTKIIENIYKMRVTALVSESESYSRYELDDKNKLTVTLYDGSAKLRSIDVGKVASSNKHTFVLLENDKNVYHARNDIKSAMDKTTSDLRDKKVLVFKTDAVTSLAITAEGELHTYTYKKAEDNDNKESGKWIDNNGKDADQAVVSAFLKSLSDLECDTFLEDSDKKNLTDPEYSITLSADKDYTLTLYMKDKDDKIPGISTDSPYAFTVSTWKFEDELKKLAQIKEEDKTE